MKLRGFGCASVVTATLLAGCSLAGDWDSFTNKNGADAPGPSDGQAPNETSSTNDGGTGSDTGGGTDATAGETGVDSGPIAPYVRVDSAIEPPVTYDLTALGPTDWFELHMKGSPNRCATCEEAIHKLEPSGSPLYEYVNDGRTFTWKNGKPTAEGSMIGGVYIEGVDNSLDLEVRADGTRQLLTLHTDTYFAGADVDAELEGAPVPKAEHAIAKLDDQKRYAIRIHFSGPARANLKVSFTLSGTVPVPAGDTPNIAFNCATLAPDPDP